MSKDFIRVTTGTEIPTSKESQVRIILEGKVYDALYRKFMSTAPIARMTDYGSFLSVTFDDLLQYLNANPTEIERLLPWETGEYREGIGILRKPDGTYELRERDHGWTTYTEQAENLERVVEKWLPRHLVAQGLRGLVPKV